MASRSSQYRKRRRFMEEVEREIDNEINNMEPSSPVMVPASTSRMFNELHSTDSNLGANVECSFSIDVDTNNTNNDSAATVDENNLDDIEDEQEECAEDFYDAYNYLNDFQSLKEALRYLAIMGHLSRNFLNLLLAILRKFGHPELPKDGRTLLKIPKVSQEIQHIAGGQMWYSGIEVGLRNYFRNHVPEENKFSLHIFIDGLPLFKSSATQFWPILFKVKEIPDCPVMIAGVFCGQKKPTDLEPYLRQLVDELNNLQVIGMLFGEKVVKIFAKAFVTDTPARAFIKSVMYFPAKHGCTKCTLVGEFVKPERKVIFCSPQPAPSRTDESFRQRHDTEHHKQIRSPLEEIGGLDMIKSFPTSDRLHLIDIGNTRKILYGLFHHKFISFVIWSSEHKKNASHFLMKTKLPSEIHRPFRSLDTLQYWKATEFRSFLHYISPVIYKDFMHSDGFNHYLLYFCGITIFSSSVYKNLNPLAKRMLQQFVVDFPLYYGRTHMSSNVHNLLHVFDDVEELGPLDDWSSYDYENFLQFIKRDVKTGSKCVEQVAGRCKLYASINVHHGPKEKKYPCLTIDGCGLHVTESFVLKPKFRDQWFLTKSNGIVKFLRAEISPQNSLVIVGIKYDNKENYFTATFKDNVSFVAIQSSELNIHKLNSYSPSTMVTLDLKSIKCKLVAVNLPLVLLCTLMLMNFKILCLHLYYLFHYYTLFFRTNHIFYLKIMIVTCFVLV
ncbi:uncharacterized protein LOC121594907 isoform X2 [Anopheles merus]|nr:uncharacterized protein LOC121594907 isoform X2 [Anopheles merus]